MENHNGSWQKIQETASSRGSAGELRERIYGKRNAATSLRHGRRRVREMREKMAENRDEAANGQVYGDESDSCVQHGATNGNDSRGKREKLVTLVTTATTAPAATIVVFG